MVISAVFGNFNLKILLLGICLRSLRDFLSHQTSVAHSYRQNLHRLSGRWQQLCRSGKPGHFSCRQLWGSTRNCKAATVSEESETVTMALVHSGGNYNDSHFSSFQRDDHLVIGNKVRLGTVQSDLHLLLYTWVTKHVIQGWASQNTKRYVQ